MWGNPLHYDVLFKYRESFKQVLTVSNYCRRCFAKINNWLNCIIMRPAFDSQYSPGKFCMNASFSGRALFSYNTKSRPRWSRGNVLASGSKVRWFKLDWGRWIFFLDVNILSTSFLGKCPTHLCLINFINLLTSSSAKVENNSFFILV